MRIQILSLELVSRRAFLMVPFCFLFFFKTFLGDGTVYVHAYSPTFTSGRWLIHGFRACKVFLISIYLRGLHCLLRLFVAFFFLCFYAYVLLVHFRAFVFLFFFGGGSHFHDVRGLIE